MDALLTALSSRIRCAKFVRCKGRNAIKNHPDTRSPKVLFYEGGKVLKQVVGLGFSQVLRHLRSCVN